MGNNYGRHITKIYELLKILNEKIDKHEKTSVEHVILSDEHVEITDVKIKILHEKINNLNMIVEGLLVKSNKYDKIIDALSDST